MRIIAQVAVLCVVGVPALIGVGRELRWFWKQR